MAFGKRDILLLRKCRKVLLALILGDPRVDCEQSFFCSRIRREERKKVSEPDFQGTSDSRFEYLAFFSRILEQKKGCSQSNPGVASQEEGIFMGESLQQELSCCKLSPRMTSLSSGCVL